MRHGVLLFTSLMPASQFLNLLQSLSTEISIYYWVNKLPQTQPLLAAKNTQENELISALEPRIYTKRLNGIESVFVGSCLEKHRFLRRYIHSDCGCDIAMMIAYAMI
jgi:hypothetical protein